MIYSLLIEYPNTYSLKHYAILKINNEKGGLDLHFIGIDIGSTSTKVAIRGDVNAEFLLPTGWNSKETALSVQQTLRESYGIDTQGPDAYVVSTGYGRVSVPYADTSITEITCHARGIQDFTDLESCTVIDVGGQDTKVISIKDGMVEDFIMNDKCSAGTGRFLEIMANRLSMTLEELFRMAHTGEVIKISSMCTVFAESEIIGLIGIGEKRENIAAGVVDSVIQKVLQLAHRHGIEGDVVLTGGLSLNRDFIEILSEQLGKDVITGPRAIYAGAIGAALLGTKKMKRRGVK